MEVEIEVTKMPAKSPPTLQALSTLIVISELYKLVVDFTTQVQPFYHIYLGTLFFFSCTFSEKDLKPGGNGTSVQVFVSIRV